MFVGSTIVDPLRAYDCIPIENAKNILSNMRANGHLLLKGLTNSLLLTSLFCTWVDQLCYQHCGQCIKKGI